MKSTLRVAAVCCCLAAAGTSLSARADATGVQLYGLVDSGLEYLTNSSADAHGHGVSLTRLTSGDLSGSRWGVKGNEDMGGGNRALFLLESGVDVTTGQTLQGGRFFGRLAYVGFANNDIGRFTVGRQGGIFLDWVSKYNPLDNAVYAVKMQDPAFSDRLDNAFRYQAKFGQVEILAQYAQNYDTVNFGNTLSTPGYLQGRVIEAGMRYSNGPLSLVLAYDQKNGGSTQLNAAMTAKVGGYEGNVDRRAAIAGKYKFNSLDVFAGYRYLDAHAVHLSALDTGPVEASDFYWLGATYHASRALALSATAMYQTFNGTQRKPLSFQLSADYSFSKRTDAYVNMGYVVNSHGSNLGLNGFGSSVIAGRNQFGVMTGIRHRF
ncbi:MAG: porin [Burkholderiaceae bacterium]|jgi:predicted porin|nr:porin [Burkholderiaceae bacterium]